MAYDNAVDGHMGALSLCYACAGGCLFLYDWGMAEPK
jgi:hypothetical protein